MDYKDYNDYELIYMVRENDEDNCDILFNKYYGIVKKIASKYFSYIKGRGADFDDLIQEGYIGFNSAINSFRENLDCSFYTFTCLCIERQIKTFCRGLGVCKNEILNQALMTDYDSISESYPSTERIDDDSFSESKFIYYKNLLSYKNSLVFELRYNGFTYKEISCLLDISVNTVDSRLCKIRKILNQYIKT